MNVALLTTVRLPLKISRLIPVANPVIGLEKDVGV
jgi:hypothetical protein